MIFPSYIFFHLIFLIPVIIILFFISDISKSEASGIIILIGLALIYTFPWDSYLISKGVWDYGKNTVISNFYNVPIEEILFIILQPLLTCFWISNFDNISGICKKRNLKTKSIGIIGGFTISILGFLVLVSSYSYYLGAILIWAGPVLGIQWGFDWVYVWKNRVKVTMGVLIPTLYLSLTDMVAIKNDIWKIYPEYTSGIYILNLPVEEVVFFFITNLFLVQGFILYEGLLERLSIKNINDLIEIIKDTHIKLS